MNLTGIISISGISGLSKVVAKTKNGLIAEGLFDKKRFPVHAADKISALEDISIFTDEGEFPLKDVLRKIRDKENSQICSVDTKGDAKPMVSYFEAILPNYDKTKVYNSDIKKVINWYNLLQQANLLVEAEEVKEDAAAEEKPKKAAKAKSEGEPKAKATKAKAETKRAAKPSTTKATKTSTIRKTGV